MPESFERTELKRWFKKIWRNTEGAVKLAFQVEQTLAWKNVMFQWPSQEESIVEWVLAKVGQGADVFYSPAIFKDNTSGKSENVLGSWVYWAEFDGNAPEDWQGSAFDKYPEPSIRLQSSIPGRQHCYWLLDTFVEKNIVEQKNRALSYELGADTSGWDAGQLLRPPCTKNYGHAKGRRNESYSVDIIHDNSSVHGPAFIEVPTHFVDIVKNAIDTTQLPNMSLVLAKGKWSDDFLESYFADEIPAKPKRSDALMWVGYCGAEAGLNDEEIYVLVENADSRWHKYTNRTPDRRFNILTDIVERARFKHPFGGGVDFATSFGKPRSAPQIVYTNRELKSLKVELKWKIKNLLTEAGMGIIGGAPGIGKTQLSNQLGISTASGTNFLTWKNECAPQRTLLLQLEMPLAGHQKLQELAQSNLSPEQLALVDENLLHSPLGSALPLDSENGRKFLVDLTQKHRPEIILIDSLAKSTMKSLNEDVPARQFNDWMQEFRKTYGVTVVFVHHTRKTPTIGKGKDFDPLDDLLGNRFITGDLDFVVSCYRVAKQKGIIYVRNPKNRYAEEHPDFTISRQPDLTFKVEQVIDSEDDNEFDSLFKRFLNGKSDRG